MKHKITSKAPANTTIHRIIDPATELLSNNTWYPWDNAIFPQKFSLLPSNTVMGISPSHTETYALERERESLWLFLAPERFPCRWDRCQYETLFWRSDFPSLWAAQITKPYYSAAIRCVKLVNRDNHYKRWTLHPWITPCVLHQRLGFPFIEIDFERYPRNTGMTQRPLARGCPFPTRDILHQNKLK